jgi:polar amino acid transport system substrate-binding protein
LFLTNPAPIVAGGADELLIRRARIVGYEEGTVRGRTLRLVVPLFATLALIGSACGSNDNNNPPASGGGGGSPSAGGPPQFTTMKPGVLQVGSCLDYPPFELVKNGKETGFDIDITDAIAKKLGLQVQWIKANFNTIFTAVAGHQFDMVAAAVTATGKTGAKRAQTVDFSNFYYDSLQSLTVNPTKTPSITNTDQLASGDVVGVQKGTTGEAWAQDNLAPKGVQIKSYTASPDSFRDLEGGAIQGVINDDQSSEAIVATQFPDLKVVQTIETNEKYALAFAKDTPDLLAAVNWALKQIVDSGEYEQIFHKYFPDAQVPPEFTPSGSASPSP